MQNLLFPINRVLDHDELMEKAPAVFAQTPDKHVTKQYEFFPTIDIVNDLATLGWYPVKAQQQKRSPMLNAKKGRKPLPTSTARHLITFENVEFKSFGKNTAERPQIVLVNSHDRTAAIQMYMGVFRLVCSNGLIVGKYSGEPLGIRHMGYSFDVVRENIQKMAAEFALVGEHITMMKNTLLTDEQQINLAIDLINTRYNQLTRDQIIDEFEVSEFLLAIREEDKPRDLWTLMNVAQEKLVKGGTNFMRFTYPSRSKQGATKTRSWKKTTAIKNIRKSVKLNTEIWNIAMQYLEAPNLN